MSPPFTHLHLSRPLVVFDLETTGLDPCTDRVVEVALLKVSPSARPLRDCLALNPGRPIPPEATAVHGLTDAHVAGCPPFAAVAPYLWHVCADADLAGFN